MIRGILDPTKLAVIEALFDHIDNGATVKEIQASLPRNAKYPERVLAELQEAGIVICANPDSPAPERVWSGNTKSKIFTQLFNIDLELGDIEHERKKKIRARMLQTKK